MSPYLRNNEQDRSVSLAVLVTPRARRSAILGPHGDSLKIALAAPPTDGKANEALLALLSETLGIAPRSLTLSSGASSRRKTVKIQGLQFPEIEARLEAAMKKTAP